MVLPWRHPGSSLSTIVYVIAQPPTSCFLTIQLLDRCCSVSASVSCVKNRFSPNTLSRGTVGTSQPRHLKKKFKKIKAQKLRPRLSPASACTHAERSGEMHYGRRVKSIFCGFATVDRVVPPPTRRDTEALPALEEEVPGI